MNKMLMTTMVILGLATDAFGHGEVYFVNSAGTSTHIYTNLVIGGWSTSPIIGGAGRIDGLGAYMFALFSAPSTVNDVALLPWLDPRWEFTGNYATNLSVPGRIAAVNPNAHGAVSIPGYAAGETVSLLVVGWGTAGGGTNLTSLIDAWNAGAYANYGYSSVAHILLGDGALLVNNFIFGAGEGQIGGFVLGIIPEPSTLALAGLGGAILLLRRRRKSSKNRSLSRQPTGRPSA